MISICFRHVFHSFNFFHFIFQCLETVTRPKSISILSFIFIRQICLFIFDNGSNKRLKMGLARSKIIASIIPSIILIMLKQPGTSSTKSKYWLLHNTFFNQLSLSEKIN